MGRPIPPGNEAHADPNTPGQDTGLDDPYPDALVAPPAYEEVALLDHDSSIRANRRHDAENSRMPLFLLTGTTSRDLHNLKGRYLGRTSIACEVNDVQDERSDSDPDFLKQWVEYMAARPPAPYIHVIGRHNETRRYKVSDDDEDKESTEEITDFRILISMQNYVCPDSGPNGMELITVENDEKTYRGTALKWRAPRTKPDLEVNHTKPGLNEWCHRYCASSSGVRVFRLTRVVTGMDEDLLSSRLEGLIRGTGYRGRLSIEFPVADRAVDVLSTSVLNEWRTTTWIRWVFYLTFLWIFSWPILHFITKKYHVVRAEWPFSQTDDQGRKKYTTLSEEEWIARFGPAVQRLCLDRYEGTTWEHHLIQVLRRDDAYYSSQSEISDRPGLVNLAVGASQEGLVDSLSQMNNIIHFAGGSGDQGGWGFDRTR
ncbi:unnamed protein product [Clonostachys rhizophaga]|uniref:Uncharacterized protein n=1 Tax=Clonostachys rhizophaga TaxID=160324 RepID=A0A9N9VWN5_9HYPO|nr:unnamed protein product [Clonostachys rhizophaga]